MARKLDSITEVRRAERKYPWSQWTDGTAWEALSGEDFTCTPVSFVAELRTKARGLSMKVRVRRGVNEANVPVVAFQFIDAKDCSD